MESLISQKRMKDMCEKYGGAGNVPLSQSLVVDMRTANTRYHKRLEREKKEKETEMERRKEEEANTERKRKAEEEKAQWDEKYSKLKEETRIKEDLLKVKQQSALQHMTDMFQVKDPTAMRSLSTAARLDQEAATNLTTEVLKLKNKLTKLVAMKLKLS